MITYTPFVLMETLCKDWFFVFGNVKKKKKIKGKLFLNFPYLAWHDIELFSIKF